jgi:hypothetical protein
VKAEGETGGGNLVTLAAGAMKDVGTIALHAAKEETRRTRVRVRKSGERWNGTMALRGPVCT